MSWKIGFKDHKLLVCEYTQNNKTDKEIFKSLSLCFGSNHLLAKLALGEDYKDIPDLIDGLGSLGENEFDERRNAIAVTLTNLDTATYFTALIESCSTFGDEFTDIAAFMVKGFNDLSNKNSTTAKLIQQLINTNPKSPSPEPMEIDPVENKSEAAVSLMQKVTRHQEFHNHYDAFHASPYSSSSEEGYDSESEEGYDEEKAYRKAIQESLKGTDGYETDDESPKMGHRM